MTKSNAKIALIRAFSCWKNGINMNSYPNARAYQEFIELNWDELNDKYRNLTETDLTFNDFCKNEFELKREDYK
tara:strand:- start:979 stop:1200 length:222 start_codon:yes stop_codon:yes gene_type:complete